MNFLRTITPIDDDDPNSTARIRATENVDQIASPGGPDLPLRRS